MFSYDQPPNWVFLQRKENSLEEINLIFFSARRHRQHDSGLAGMSGSVGVRPTRRKLIQLLPTHRNEVGGGSIGDSGDCLFKCSNVINLLVFNLPVSQLNL